MNPRGDRLVSLWLFWLCFMVFGIIAGGGHARTIGAGFILQTWQPFTGFLPPGNAAAWQHLFGLYQQTAQYRALHPAMTLAGFQALFWPMFLDRVWARLLAVALLVPLALFWWRRRISGRLALWLLAIFAAGGAQAAFGWAMVRTGMSPNVTMPPPAYLAPHLLLGMLIFGALLWTALTVRRPVPEPVPGGRHLRLWLNACILLIFLTMGMGALVAATNAVTVFHSFPLMAGRWIPPGTLALHPLWMNFLANQATVQFDHRLAASLTALVVLTTAVLGLRAELPAAARDGFLILAGLLGMQYLLGMVTVVTGSANLGYVHELNAVLLFAAAIIARHGLRGAAHGAMLVPSIAAAGAP